jgi:hypothetical protein
MEHHLTPALTPNYHLHANPAVYSGLGPPSLQFQIAALTRQCRCAELRSLNEAAGVVDPNSPARVVTFPLSAPAGTTTTTTMTALPSSPPRHSPLAYNQTFQFSSLGAVSSIAAYGAPPLPRAPPSPLHHTFVLNNYNPPPATTTTTTMSTNAVPAGHGHHSIGAVLSSHFREMNPSVMPARTYDYAEPRYLPQVWMPPGAASPNQSNFSYSTTLPHSHHQQHQRHQQHHQHHHQHHRFGSQMGQSPVPGSSYTHIPPPTPATNTATTATTATTTSSMMLPPRRSD